MGRDVWEIFRSAAVASAQQAKQHIKQRVTLGDCGPRSNRMTDNKCDTQEITADWRCTEIIVLSAKAEELFFLLPALP